MVVVVTHDMKFSLLNNNIQWMQVAVHIKTGPYRKIKRPTKARNESSPMNQIVVVEIERNVLTVYEMRNETYLEPLHTRCIRSILRQGTR